MAIQYFRGSYGKVEMAPMMACIMITVIPVIVLYLACQKYIIDGVVAAVRLRVDRGPESIFRYERGQYFYENQRYFTADFQPAVPRRYRYHGGCGP